jgi:hypothetical protein
MKSKRNNRDGGVMVGGSGMHGDMETNNILYVEGLSKVTQTPVLNEWF